MSGKSVVPELENGSFSSFRVRFKARDDDRTSVVGVFSGVIGAIGPTGLVAGFLLGVDGTMTVIMSEQLVM